MTFLEFMFLPPHQPWYTGAFWSNQTQWTIVTLPSLLVLLWRIERHHKQHMHEVKKLHKKIGEQK